MKVRYVGPIDAVEIAATGQEVARGAEAEVPDELGTALCEQADWEQVVSQSRPRSVKGGES